MNQEFAIWLKGQEKLASEGVKRTLAVDVQVSLLRRLQMMFQSGVTLTDCIEALRVQEVDPLVERMLAQVLDEICSGMSLSVALGRQNLRFPSRVLASIRLGETSGQLALILNDLADGVEREQELTQRVKSAFTYPCLLAAGAALAMLGMFFFFIPQLIEFSRSVEASVGPWASLLFSAADLFCQPTVVVAFLQTLGALGFLLYCFMKTQDGRKLWARLSLDLPVVGSVLQQVALLRFTYAFKTLLRSGFPLVNALDLLAETADNLTLKEQVVAARQSIIEGAELAPAFRDKSCFDSTFLAFLEVGQSSGKLERMLEATLQLRKLELETKLDTAVSLLEPLVLSVLGAVVAMVTLLFFLPMANLVQVL